MNLDRQDYNTQLFNDYDAWNDEEEVEPYEPDRDELL